MENSVAIPQKVKHRIIIWPSNSIPRYIHKRIENRYSNKNLYINVHSSIIHNSPKVQTIQYPSTNEWINKMWYTHMVEYYSSIKRVKIKKMLTHATTWVNFENIMLSKRSLTQMTTYYRIPFTWNVHNMQIYRSILVAKVQGEGETGSDC